MEKEFSGYCPKLNQEYAVIAHYCNIPILGSTKENFKLSHIDCNYDNENNCEFCNQCPLVK